MNQVSFEQEPHVGEWNENAFNRSFRHEVATAGNVRIHYVIGGNGPLVTLLHGFPQHWREWRHVMPMLAEAGYTVVGCAWTHQYDRGHYEHDTKRYPCRSNCLVVRIGRGGGEGASWNDGTTVAAARWDAIRAPFRRRATSRPRLQAGLAEPHDGRLGGKRRPGGFPAGNSW